MYVDYQFVYSQFSIANTNAQNQTMNYENATRLVQDRPTEAINTEQDQKI